MEFLLSSAASRLDRFTMSVARQLIALKTGAKVSLI